MARTKEFDRDIVLRKAVAAFRERGFEGTSIQVLVDRMGIHRASLYDTYGSKEQLFREVLEDYADLVHSNYYGQVISTESYNPLSYEVNHIINKIERHDSCPMKKVR